MSPVVVVSGTQMVGVSIDLVRLMAVVVADVAVTAIGLALLDVVGGARQIPQRAAQAPRVGQGDALLEGLFLPLAKPMPPSWWRREVVDSGCLTYLGWSAFGVALLALIFVLLAEQGCVQAFRPTLACSTPRTPRGIPVEGPSRRLATMRHGA